MKIQILLKPTRIDTARGVVKDAWGKRFCLEKQ